MSDSEDSIQARRPLNAETSAATAAQFASLSDDESDDGRVKAPNRPPPRTPPPRSRSPSPVRSPDKFSSRQPPREPTPKPSLMKEVGMTGARSDTVDIMHFPPNIKVRNDVTTSLENLPDETHPILYRLKPSARKQGQSAAETMMDIIKKGKNDPFVLANALESNAKIVKWSDGSRTLQIGSSQFLIIEDAVASKHVLFREEGRNAQTFESMVDKVVRVQPSSTSDAKAKLAMATAAMKAAGKRRESRTMLRCMDEHVEQHEAKAKAENMRKERERARLETRRRQTRERHVRPNRALTVDQLESDYESDEDHVRKMEERFDTERLMRAKRTAPSRPREVPLKRRKAGGRRVLGDDDESDESD